MVHVLWKGTDKTIEQCTSLVNILTVQSVGRKSEFKLYLYLDIINITWQ